MKIYIGADHRGVQFKSGIKDILKELGFEAEDMGTSDENTSCDYPRIASRVAARVAADEGSRGILVCMSGIGQAIAANKVKGAYAALCYNAEAAKLSREHNNANILVLSSRFTANEELPRIIKTWLTTEFEGGRHQRRLDLIKQMEDGKVLK